MSDYFGLYSVRGISDRRALENLYLLCNRNCHILDDRSHPKYHQLSITILQLCKSLTDVNYKITIESLFTDLTLLDIGIMYQIEDVVKYCLEHKCDIIHTDEEHPLIEAAKLKNPSILEMIGRYMIQRNSLTYPKSSSSCQEYFLDIEVGGSTALGVAKVRLYDDNVKILQYLGASKSVFTFYDLVVMYLESSDAAKWIDGELIIRQKYQDVVKESLITDIRSYIYDAIREDIKDNDNKLVFNGYPYALSCIEQTVDDLLLHHIVRIEEIYSVVKIQSTNQYVLRINRQTITDQPSF